MLKINNKENKVIKTTPIIGNDNNKLLNRHALHNIIKKSIALDNKKDRAVSFVFLFNLDDIFL